MCSRATHYRAPCIAHHTATGAGAVAGVADIALPPSLDCA